MIKQVTKQAKVQTQERGCGSGKKGGATSSVAVDESDDSALQDWEQFYGIKGHWASAEGHELGSQQADFNVQHCVALHSRPPNTKLTEVEPTSTEVHGGCQTVSLLLLCFESFVRVCILLASRCQLRIRSLLHTVLPEQ